MLLDGEIKENEKTIDVQKRENESHINSKPSCTKRAKIYGAVEIRDETRRASLK